MYRSRSIPVALAHRLAFAIFLIWSSTLSALSDPEQWLRGGFTTDFSKATVSLDTIFSGGPPKDGIPSIDTPVFETAHEISWLDDREPVIRLELDGVVKAYPLKILIWHEIVNDAIGAVPVSVTYCPLCNSSIVFDRRLDGEVLDFGTTGLLRHSDLVMYDRQSESWWQQFTGKGIVGVHAGRDLKMVPSRVVAFGVFKENHPDAKVLARPDPPMRNYGAHPYAGYDSRSAPYPLFQGELPENINPMARVVVVRDGDNAFAATLDHVRQESPVELADNIELRWTGEQASILDKRDTRNGRAIGTVEAVRMDKGNSSPLVHDVTFAFVVNAFHPELPILGIKTP